MSSSDENEECISEGIPYPPCSVGCSEIINSPESVVYCEESPFPTKEVIENISHPAVPEEDVRSLVCSRIASSADISSIASFPEYDLNSTLLPLEVRQKLSNLIQTKGPDLLQACKNFDRRSTNKIPKTQLRQVLRTFCFPITAAQFDSLCEYVNLSSTTKVNYRDFFLKISGLNSIPDSRKSEKISKNLPVDEVELRIKEKIKPRLRDIIRSFWLFDVNKDGLIQKSELRRIIRNYCFDMSDDRFDELWKNYDPKGIGVIKYQDFLIKLGINTDRYIKYMPPENVASSLSWTDKKAKDKINDVHHEQRLRRIALENRDDPAIQGLPMEEVMAIFVHRLRRQENLLLNTFKLFDYEKNGQISLSDFQGVLNFFVMPMSSTLFNRAMKRMQLDISQDNKLDYQDFLQLFRKTNSCYKSGDARESEKVDCAPIVQRIKNRVLNPESRLRSVFTRTSKTDKEWQITRPELRKAVELGLDFKLTDEEYRELSNLLDPRNTNLIKCMDFLRIFEGPCDKICAEGNATGTTDFSGAFDVEKYSKLNGYKLKSKLKHHLNKNILNVERAVLVCDPDQSGFILPERLCDILSVFCIPLSHEQFQEVSSDLRNYGQRINYKDFFEMYKKKPDDDINKWIATVDKLAPFKTRCPPEMPVDEGEEMLFDCVRSRKTGMLKDFKALDMCNVGVVCKEDVKTVFNKYAFRFNDKQFNTLWNKFPRNKYDQLLYDQFLEEYSAAEAKNESLSPKTQENGKYKNEEKEKEVIVSEGNTILEPDSKVYKDSKEIRKSAKEILCSKAPDLKKIFDSIESAIIRNFRTIRFNLRRADPKVTGMVDFKVLKRILAKSSIYFSKEDEFQILEQFDTDCNGKINYRDFLQIFVWYA